MYGWIDQFLSFCQTGSPAMRAALAALLGFASVLWIGPRAIAWLSRRCQEPIECDSKEIEALHRHKARTPTLGGLFLLPSLLFALFLLADMQHASVQAAVFITLGMGLVGLIDDLTKLRRGQGISGRAKLAGQTAVAVVAVLAVQATGAHSDLTIPWTEQSMQLGWFYVPLAILILVGTSNGVNLTDGLDGLAAGNLLLSFSGMAILLWIAIPYFSGGGELLVVVGATLGALAGFLRFNRHPARVFMGDTGSLALGGLLGWIAIAARMELMLLLLGGVFVVETVSVLLQVAFYKWRRQRIFLCAPLHHHFQLLGWSEKRIVSRFCFSGALCVAFGIASFFITTKSNFQNTKIKSQTNLKSQKSNIASREFRI